MLALLLQSDGLSIGSSDEQLYGREEPLRPSLACKTEFCKTRILNQESVRFLFRGLRLLLSDHEAR